MAKRPERFSPKEIELLSHRLGVPDCLAEVLADHEDDEIAALAVMDGGDAVYKSCTKLEAWIERKVPVGWIVDNATQLERLILADVIEGSTYVACHSEEEAPVRTAAIRAAKSAVRKLRAAGLEVGDVPIY